MENKLLNKDICLIGLGPAGIGFVNEFIGTNYESNLICVEQGKNIINRVSFGINEKSNELIVGFGGSALFSGSKLSLFPAGKNLTKIVDEKINVESILDTLLAKYSKYLNLLDDSTNKKLILEGKHEYKKRGFLYKYYKAKCFKTSELLGYYQKLHNEISDSKIVTLYNSKVYNIAKKNDFFVVKIIHLDKKIEIICKKVILGVGRLGKSLIKIVNDNFKLESYYSRFDVGIRIEYPTNLFPEIDHFHRDLKIYSNNCKTFCVCKNGKVISYLNNGIYFSEGVLNIETPTEFTNLAILYSLKNSTKTEELILEINKKLNERISNLPIRQNYFDFINSYKENIFDSPTTLDSYQTSTISDFLPTYIFNSIKTFLQKFINLFLSKSSLESINIFFPEINYGYLNFKMKKDFSIYKNIYLIGECTGMIVGILQSEISGQICAKNIIDEFK